MLTYLQLVSQRHCNKCCQGNYTMQHQLQSSILLLAMMADIFLQIITSQSSQLQATQPSIEEKLLIAINFFIIYYFLLHFKAADS